MALFNYATKELREIISSLENIKIKKSWFRFS